MHWGVMESILNRQSQGQTTDHLQSQAVLDVTCSWEPVQILELGSDLMSTGT